MNKRNFFLSLFGASILGAFIALGAFIFIGSDSTESNPTINGMQAQQPVQFVNGQSATPVGVDFTRAAEISTPGVVHIKTFKDVQYGTYYHQTPFDDFFRDFFGDQYQQQQPTQPNQNNQQQAGSGSGVILTVDGYIATNNHVIAGADRIEVTLNDRRRYEAELIGTDPSTDLALLKIAEQDLQFLQYGNSDNTRIGEWVLAVGNPFDLTSTVTAGIVSAKARNINILKEKSNYAIESFIQTDAAVNPGNSGGALVDLNGRLIGINTAIATPTGTYAGYSFAVPVSLVQKVMDDLLKYGQVQRALLGVSIRDVDAALAEEKNLESVNGVYIAGVREGGAAHDAGLEAEDVIIAIDGSNINSSSELQEMVARHQPGDHVDITVIRSGNRKTIKTTLKNKLGTTNIVKKDEESLVPLLGANLRSINEEERDGLRIDNGVKVVQLESGKLKQQGIREGFIITKIDRKRVHNPGDVAALLSNDSGAVLIEGIYPSGKRAYYAIGW